jgi:hypothetical protein
MYEPHRTSPQDRPEPLARQHHPDLLDSGTLARYIAELSVTADHGTIGEEGRAPALRQVAESGRRFHREWCESVFAATLASLTGASRHRRLAQLVAVCDVHTWRLLRRDASLSRRETELALRELIEPLLEGS